MIIKRWDDTNRSDFEFNSLQKLRAVDDFLRFLMSLEKPLVSRVLEQRTKIVGTR